MTIYFPDISRLGLLSFFYVSVNLKYVLNNKKTKSVSTLNNSITRKHATLFT